MINISKRIFSQLHSQRKYLEQFLSNKYLYGKLGPKNNSDDCIKKEGVSNAENQIGVYLKAGNHAKDIVRAWCHIHETEKGEESNDDLCYAFYYWLGGEVSKNLNTPGSFQTVMGEIYNELRKLNRRSKCTRICPDIDQNEFDKRKIIYDYSEDYLLILTYSPTGNERCCKEYSDYLKKVVETYQDVYTSCGSNASSTCCKKFEAVFGKYGNGKPSDLTCNEVSCPGDDFDLGDAVVDGGNDDPPPPPKLKPNPNPNQAGSSGSFSDADLVDGVSGGEGKGGSDGGGSHRKEGEQTDNPGIVPAAVSGALAGIGLPALAYFFYKYKPFFLRKHDRSEGRRRKRSLRRKFNEFDDDDDTLTTAYSSEYSIPYTTSSSTR
ncbi:Variable surface protein Vir7-like protein [Plasmodium coatneyi]|uniref:Variable surface protein Vir7-like protein n=1 Tax=Plasmodium coatneyi TaxID=208452 RepID=A0A1B1DTZ5_9APIC|nr:Variable surface protein Vir7-like protein [Plasmodium coatneyi]ANQ06214.1 Variable surface protein Vir7-like protein [Plasmodium coatneyi]